MISVTPKQKQTLIEQYEAIRKGGDANMYSKNLVQRIAFNNDFYELVNLITDGNYAWILENYGELITMIDPNSIEPAYL